MVDLHDASFTTRHRGPSILYCSYFTYQVYELLVNNLLGVESNECKNRFIASIYFQKSYKSKPRMFAEREKEQGIYNT